MKIFRNAMFFEVILEVAAGIMDCYVLLDICITALATTTALWFAFLASQSKTKEVKHDKN